MVKKFVDAMSKVKIGNPMNKEKPNWGQSREDLLLELDQIQVIAKVLRVHAEEKN